MVNEIDAVEGEIAGDTMVLEITVYEDGEPKNLTEADVSWALLHVNSSDEEVSNGDVETEIVSETDGELRVTVPAGETGGLAGTYRQRLRVSDYDDNKQTWIGEVRFVDVG